MDEDGTRHDQTCPGKDAKNNKTRLLYGISARRTCAPNRVLYAHARVVSACLDIRFTREMSVEFLDTKHECTYTLTSARKPIKEIFIGSDFRLIRVRVIGRSTHFDLAVGSLVHTGRRHRVSVHRDGFLGEDAIVCRRGIDHFERSIFLADERRRRNPTIRLLLRAGVWPIIGTLIACCDELEVYIYSDFRKYYKHAYIAHTNLLREKNSLAINKREYNRARTRRRRDGAPAATATTFATRLTSTRARKPQETGTLGRLADQ